MEKICKNCKSWDELEDKDDLKELGFYKGACDDKHFIYTGDGFDKILKDGLGYWDQESYAAGFDTGPEFGCKFYENKRKEKS